jgi:predicted nucleotidyltransferase
MERNDKKKLFNDSPEKRKEFITLISEDLSSCPEAVFAYIYGSLLEDLPYEDIDLGIHFSFSSDEAAHKAALDLASKLSRKLKRPVDVRPLNNATTGFLYHVFRGRLILDRNEDLRVHRIERVIMRYLDMKPLLERSLKEAMSR